MTFTVDPRLTDNAFVALESQEMMITLVNDRRWPWLVVIPKVPNVSELYELPSDVRSRLNEFSALLGREWMALTDGDKLNVACIGNVVRQLHMHHVVRYTGDTAWPAPVWGVGESVPYEVAQRDQLIGGIRARLVAAGVPAGEFAGLC